MDMCNNIYIVIISYLSLSLSLASFYLRKNFQKPGGGREKTGQACHYKESFLKYVFSHNVDDWF